MVVASEAGTPLSIDNFTDQMKKMGYTRVRVQLDATKPLQPGVLIQGENKVF